MSEKLKKNWGVKDFVDNLDFEKLAHVQGFIVKKISKVSKQGSNLGDIL